MLRSLASRTAANTKKNQPRMCFSKAGVWIKKCSKNRSPPMKLQRLQTPNMKQTGTSIDDVCQLRHVRKIDVGSAIATNSTCVCSNGTVPGSCNKFAACHPRTIMIPDPNPQMPLPIFAAIHSVQQPANGKRQPAEPLHYTRGKQTYPVRLIRYQKIYAVSLLKLCYRRATRSSTQRAHRSTLNGCATFLLQSVSQTPPEHHTYTLVLPTVCLLARVAYVLQLVVTLPVLPKSPPI